MSITPSKYIKKNRKKGTFNFKQSLADRIGADTYNTDIDQFNKDYSADYLTNWHSADEINSYYDRLASLTDRTKAYQSYVNLYGTDEQKSVLGDIDKQVKSYSDVLGQRQNVLDYYGGFADAQAYTNAIAYQEQKIAENKAEEERIASLDLDAVRAEIANIDKQVAQYESNKKKVYAVPNANINEVEAYARDMNNRIQALKEQKSSLESDISARELMDRQRLYADILGSSEFASFVPVDDGLYDSVEMANEPPQKTNTIAPFQYDNNSLSSTDMSALQHYGSARYSYMEDEEYKLYQFLQEHYGQKAAGQYAYDLDNELISREQEELKTFAQEHPWLGTVASFATSPIQGIDFIIGGAEKALTGNMRQGEMTAVTSSLREGASPKGELGSFLYNTATSGVDSVLATAIGGKAGGVILGLSAASSTMNDVLARGGTAEQALTSGVASGLFEGFFESFSIGRLTSMKPEEIVKSFKTFASNVAKDIAVNASEELATEVANIVFDTAFMGELSNAAIMLDQYMSQGMTESEAKTEVAKQLGLQVLEAGASGALMGAGFSAIGGGVGLAKTDSARRQLGKEQIKTGKVDSILTEAKEFFKDSKYKSEQDLIKKVEANLGKQGMSQQRNIGKLTEALFNAKFRELNKSVAEQSIENVAETRKNVESEAKKLKVNTSSAEITFDNMPRILGFEGANLDRTMVETEQGAVKLTDMEISNAEIGDLYAYAVRLGNTESANAFIQNWDQTTDPLYYWLDWTKLQTRGLYAPEKIEKAMSDYSDVKLSPAAKLAAFKSGVSLRTSAREKMEADSAKLKETYKELGGTAKKGKFDDSKLNYSALTKEQKDVVNFTRILSDYLGVNITYFKSEKGKRGANGYYSAKNNTIYLDIYAGIGNKESYSAIKDCLVNTVSHEIVHNMAVNAPAEYGALRDFVIERLSEEEGFDLDSKVEQIMLENSDQGFTAEDAIEEIVAMSCEDLLGSSERLQEAMTQFYAKNEKAANSFTKYVREVLNRLKQFFEKIIGKKSIAEESQLMAKQSAEFISELQKRYDAALLAVKEGNAARGAQKADEKVKEQARAESEDESFYKQLKDWQRGNGKANGNYNGNFFKLGNTPNVLIKHGTPKGEMIMYEDCLIKITGGKHSISLDELSKIPSQLNDPILLFKGSVEKSFVALTEIKDKNGHDVIVVVHIDKRLGRSVINKISSVYSKTDDNGKNKISSYVTNQINSGNLIYASAKKAPIWFTTSGLQLPHVVQTIIDANNSIPDSSENVNPSDEKNFEQKRIETPGASEVLSDLFRDNPNLNGYAEQKKELKSYQELLRSVRVNEQRIAEIDAEIKSLKSKHAQSGKGTRIAELYEMRKRAEDRVKEKKNRMFKMEATSLKEVIQKETARLLTERSKEERDLSKKQQKEIRENYARREYIKKIEDRAKGLTNAVKNVGDKHVPAPLREAIANLVMSLDFSSKSKLAGKGDTKKDIQFADAFRQLANLVSNKLPNTTDKETAPLDEFFIDCDITDEFRDQFEEIKNEIDNIVYRRGGSGEDTYVLRNLSSEQLRQINSALYKLGKQISKANQLMENNLYKNVIEMSEDFLTFADKFVLKQDVKWLEKLIDVDNLIPYYAFKRMGKVGLSLFNEWADGMDKYAKVAKEIVDFTNSLYTAKEIKEWNNTVHEIEIKGKKLYFTTAHLMSFYCLWKREAAKSHISGYGIRVETFDVDKTAKKPLGKTYTNPANGVHITDETAQILLDELNKDKRAKVVADALQKYMSTRCAELANEITMKRFGEKAYTEEFYFPMEVNENEKPVDGDINSESLYALVNKSFTKQLTPNSTSSLTIRNIFDVFASHTTDVAAYHSLAIPLLDTLKFYNYKQKGYDVKGDSEAKTVRGKIVEAFGEPFLNYLKNFIKDTTGTSITSDRGSNAVGKWVSRYKIAAVAANLRVIVLQPTSYLRVSAVMKHRYLVKEIKDIPQLNKAVERMNKYSGVALWKNELGFRDVNISRSLADKIKHADTVGDKVTEVAMKGAEFADKITWANIWLACEEEIKATEKNIPVGSDAFYDKVSKRFRNVIYSTQVVDSPLAKSNMARSKSFWNRTVTSFMSEPVVSHNLLLDAYHELADAKRRGEEVKWENVRKVGRLVMAYSINATAQAVVSSLIDAARKIADDEDEEFADAYWGEFISNFLQELNPLSKIPIIKDIIDVIRATFSNGYYSGQSMETAVFDRVAKAVKESYKFFSGESSTTKLVKRIMDAISSLTGIPIGNTYREIKTIWNNLMEWFNGGSSRIE